eukprot:2415051-Amphidinium_carterae.1
MATDSTALDTAKTQHDTLQWCQYPHWLTRRSALTMMCLARTPGNSLERVTTNMHDPPTKQKRRPLLHPT